MTPDECLAILKDTTKPLADRIRAAVRLKLIYVERKDKPNLPREDFLNILNYMPRNSLVDWDDRKTWTGPHGTTGEDKVFMTSYDVTFGRLTHEYFIKGFFFDKNDLKGVVIQSFRRIIKSRKELKLVRR